MRNVNTWWSKILATQNLNMLQILMIGGRCYGEPFITQDVYCLHTHTFLNPSLQLSTPPSLVRRSHQRNGPLPSLEFTIRSVKSGEKWRVQTCRIRAPQQQQQQRTGNGERLPRDNFVNELAFSRIVTKTHGVEIEDASLLCLKRQKKKIEGITRRRERGGRAARFLIEETPTTILLEVSEKHYRFSVWIFFFLQNNI